MLPKKIEVYGIPEGLGYSCYSCINAVRLLEYKGLPYTFIPVLRKADNSLGFDYERDNIHELAKRIKAPSLAIVYPQIFIDGEAIGSFKALKEYLD